MTQKDPLADLPWPGAAVAPSEECSKAIASTCTKGLCQRRGMTSTTRALSTLAFSLALLAFYTWYAVMDARPSGIVRTALYGAGGWLGAQALLVFAMLARPPGKRASGPLRVALLIGLPVLFVLYLALVSTERFSFAHFSQGNPAGHALGCGLLALLFGALVAGGAMLAWRRTDPFTPGVSGATIGVFGGLASGVGMSVACPSHELLHSCFAHGLIVFALALGGFGLGRKLLSP